MKQVTILGAGISGLSTSFHIGHESCQIYEAKAHFGGHIFSFVRDGFTWDDGPHVLFTDSEYVKQVLGESVNGEFEERAPEVTNYYKGHWIDHPAQSNLYQVPEPLRTQCLESFLEARSHVVNYSVPVKATMTLSELRPHLHSLPDHPDWIPYRTSYYKEQWGFCLPHRQLLELKDETYEVCIDSTLENGFLTYGECLLKGRQEAEVLLSCHASERVCLSEEACGLRRTQNRTVFLDERNRILCNANQCVACPTHCSYRSTVGNSGSNREVVGIEHRAVQPREGKDSESHQGC